MAAEMNQYRHDMERRLTEKEEELESIKYSSDLPCLKVKIKFFL